MRLPRFGWTPRANFAEWLVGRRKWGSQAFADEGGMRASGTVERTEGLVWRGCPDLGSRRGTACGAAIEVGDRGAAGLRGAHQGLGSRRNRGAKPAPLVGELPEGAMRRRNTDSTCFLLRPTGLLGGSGVEPAMRRLGPGAPSTEDARTSAAFVTQGKPGCRLPLSLRNLRQALATAQHHILHSRP